MFPTEEGCGFSQAWLLGMQKHCMPTVGSLSLRLTEMVGAFDTISSPQPACSDAAAQHAATLATVPCSLIALAQ
jgi:hypothetical protein